MAKPETSIKRFYKNFVAVDGCWIWTATEVKGYGKMMAFGERYAHRVSYVIHKGKLSKDMEVMHVCDNSICVNPAHLRKGSHSENMKDMVVKGRSARGEKQRNAKLTEQQVIQLRKSPGLARSLSRKFGVAEITARQAQRGVTWKYLNEAVMPL